MPPGLNASATLGTAVTHYDITPLIMMAGASGLICFCCICLTSLNKIFKCMDKKERQERIHLDSVNESAQAASIFTISWWPLFRRSSTVFTSSNDGEVQPLLSRSKLRYNRMSPRTKSSKTSNTSKPESPKLEPASVEAS